MGVKMETMDYIARCVNDNRYNAVMSKEGELHWKNMSKIMKLMAIDVFEDLQKDRADEIESMDEKRLRFVRKFIDGAVKAFFRLKTRRLREKDQKEEKVELELSDPNVLTNQAKEKK